MKAFSLINLTNKEIKHSMKNKIVKNRQRKNEEEEIEIMKYDFYF